MRSSRVRRVKRTARKSIGRELSRMPRSKRSNKSNSTKRSLLDELRETLSLPELESEEQPVSVNVPKKKKSKKKKKKSKAWSAKLHGKGKKGKKGKKSHKKKHKKKMKGGSVNELTIERNYKRETVPFLSFVKYKSVNTKFPMEYLVYNNMVYSASGSYTNGEFLTELGTFDTDTSTLTYASDRKVENIDGDRVNQIKIVPATDKL